MNIFLALPILFVLGSVVGWFIEFFHRHTVNKRFINPGFLLGPYVPIYGIGLIILFLLADSSFYSINNFFVRTILFVLISTILVTLLEYLTGFIFIKTLKIRLWDYSDQKGNIQGLICPLYIFYWALISALYYALIHNIMISIVDFVFDNQIIFIIVGSIIGLMAIDFLYSTNIIFGVRKWANENSTIVKYYSLKRKTDPNYLLEQLNIGKFK